MSEEAKTDEVRLLEALVRAQTNMAKVAKTAKNPQFKSKYATFEDIHEASVPHLNAEGIFYSAHFVTDQIITTFRMGTALTACEIPLIVSKHDAQGFRSAVTYARKAGLELLAGLSTSDNDDDGNAAAANPPPKPKPSRLPEMLERVAHLTDLESLEKARAAIQKMTLTDNEYIELEAALNAKNGEFL